MSAAIDSSVITCGACQRKFAWKPELAGKRVKCKCGDKITVPAAPAVSTPAVKTSAVASKSAVNKPAIAKQAKPVATKPVVAPPKKPAPAEPSDGVDLDGLMALADDADRAAAAMPPEVIDFVPVPVVPITAKAAKQAGGKTVLGYQRGPTALEKQKANRHATALIDPVRDLYAPIGFLVAGLALYLAYFILRYHLGSQAIVPVCLGVFILTAIKTVLLVGFALVMAGPLGVSFGGLWTAILKLAAIAVFTDGVTGWVDFGVAKMSGGFGSGGLLGLGMIGWPVAFGCYWGLLIYLFSMDPGESYLVVICLAVFDRIVRTVLLILLVETFLSWGGVAVPASPALGGGGSGGGSSLSTPAGALATEVDNLKQTGMLAEAKQYIADGHQAALDKPVRDWYANGCPNVWFEMHTTDMLNHKRSARSLIVELPKGKAQRAKCFDILRAYYKDAGLSDDPADVQDDGGAYLQVGL